jgi:hypothetical protein
MVIDMVIATQTQVNWLDILFIALSGVGIVVSIVLGILPLVL